MAAPETPTQVRLGVIGLGRAGLFALERWHDGSDVRIVAACDREANAVRRAEGLCGRLPTDERELLGDPDIDVIFVAVPPTERVELARRVFEAGKHLLVETPLAIGLRHAEVLSQAAEALGRQIVVWSPWRDEPDFRAARQVVGSGLIGAIRMLRLERWEPAELDPSCSIDAVLPDAVVGALDQLVAFANRPAERVTAVPLPQGGCTATAVFQGGIVGVVTLKMSASLRLDLGWLIDAERGGYAAGRRWVRTDEGEVYELPTDVPGVDLLEETLRHVVAGGSRTAEVCHHIRFASLIDAVARSLRTGRTEAVEPTG